MGWRINHRHFSILILVKQFIAAGDRFFSYFGRVWRVAGYRRAQYRRVITAGPILVPSGRLRLQILSPGFRDGNLLYY